METLAVKYRPKTLDDIIGQDILVKILKRELELDQISHCYLFCGYSGIGKTTTARGVAYSINKGLGSPIEIDGASNNGVENVRNIIEMAHTRAIDGAKYKIFIIDECHALTSAAWNALLKTIEEPPEYSIFIFCTTDPQKIPATIMNRVSKYQLQRISVENIVIRLKYICECENFSFEEDALNYIARISEGGMRTAIAHLEKVSKYSEHITLENCLKVLGNCNYDIFFKLTNSISDNVLQDIVTILDSIDRSGSNMSTFITQYINFILDLGVYCMFNSIETTTIPSSFLNDVKYATGLFPTRVENMKYFTQLANRLLDIRNNCKDAPNLKNSIEIYLLGLSAEMIERFPRG